MKRYCLCLLLMVYLLPVYAQVPGAAADVLHYGFKLTINDADNNVKGKATIDLSVLKDAPMLQFDLVAKDSSGKGMLVSGVTEQGRKIPFKQAGEALQLLTPVKAKSKHSYVITYTGIPADGLIISTNKYGARTFFGDNWLRRARYWLPCIDNVADKATVDFAVTAPAHYTVVANGLKIKEAATGKTKTTYWSEKVPLPTKVMVIAAADFAVERSGTVKGIPVYSYVFPQDKAAGFKSYACAAQILPVFIDKIGPFAYEKLANVQSKTIFGGMENASAIFYYENSVDDNEVEALVAHEIAHQWFGDAATERRLKDVWLSEGFATFMANYYHEYKYGADSLKKRLQADRRKILAYKNEWRYPVVDTTPYKDPMDMLNTDSYEKGGWVLHMLRRKLGDTVFWRGVRNYYARYKNGNADTDDLLAVMEQTSDWDLKRFFKQWLYTPGHPKLSIGWRYNPNNHLVNIRIEQKQPDVYWLKPEIKIGDKLYTFDVADRVYEVWLHCPQRPNGITIDPNVNLLAEYEVEELK